jgi:ligand-binding SRPBCC domain-containing protein
MYDFNLNEITPPDLNFEIIHEGIDTMYEGQLIEYRVQFMPVIKSRWLTEIAHIEAKSYFVDEQRIGPYRFWYHEHFFKTVQSGTQIRDRVTYSLPFGPLGNIVHMFWIKSRLEKIFDYRHKKVEQLFY